MHSALLLVSATLLSYVLGWAIGSPSLLPILNTLPAFPFMFLLLRKGRVGQAIALMLLWAAALGACSTAFSYLDPEGSARLFINADAYRREMFFWVQTGGGAESDPARFVPTHALHASVFCALSLASGSVLSMPMGAVLMNYMGHFVGALAAVATRPLLTAAAGWVPWSLVRVASFVTLGVVLAGPVLSRLAGFPYQLRRYLPVVVIALAGLVVDIVLKAVLAPTWQGLLKSLVGW